MSTSVVARPETSGNAVTSLVLVVVSCGLWFWFPDLATLGGVLSLILALCGLWDIRRSHGRVRGYGFAIITLVLLAVAGRWVWSSQAASLPGESEVESMTATLDLDSQKLPELHPKQHGVQFEVPAEHIPKILAALRPARRDWFPAKWVEVGELNIPLKDGTTLEVDLYLTRAGTDAFSVHPDYPHRPRNGVVSNYFRGGTDSGILEAIRAAYADFQSRQPTASGTAKD